MEFSFHNLDSLKKFKNKLPPIPLNVHYHLRKKNPFEFKQIFYFLSIYNLFSQHEEGNNNLFIGKVLKAFDHIKITDNIFRHAFLIFI